jgi:hypothetical protein
MSCWVMRTTPRPDSASLIVVEERPGVQIAAGSADVPCPEWVFLSSAQSSVIETHGVAAVGLAVSAHHGPSVSSPLSYP